MIYSLMMLVVLLVLLGGLSLHRLSDIGRQISTQSPFSTQTGYMTGSGRVNVLILAYSGIGQGPYATDSMMVVSLNLHSGSTTEISVPRDLWVAVSANFGYHAKLNAAFVDGFYNGFRGEPPGHVAGGNEAAAKVSEVLGMNVPYWVTIDFAGFQQVVDSLGGIDVDVPYAFTANFPANEDPSINPNWEIIHFNAGWQHMDGARALEFVSARYITDPVSEAGDFARTARQQLVVQAILAKARQITTWPSLNGAADALTKTIYTNLSLTDLMLFAMRMDTTHAVHIGLSVSNALVYAESADGQSILLPANGDWSAIQRYVRQHLAA